jgi:hypothetical protein
VIGTEREIADFDEFIQAYGLVQTLSIASVGMRARLTQQAKDQDSQQAARRFSQEEQAQDYRTRP